MPDLKFDLDKTTVLTSAVVFSLIGVFRFISRIKSKQMNQELILLLMLTIPMAVICSILWFKSSSNMAQPVNGVIMIALVAAMVNMTANLFSVKDQGHQVSEEQS